MKGWQMKKFQSIPRKLTVRLIMQASTVLVAGGLAFAAVAQQAAPDQQMKSLSSEVIVLIKGDKLIQQGDPKRIAEVIETKIVPQFNLARMTALAVGANWRKATPDQQKQLAEQFKTLLVRTYSSGLSAYRDQQIDFKPLRAAAADTEVVVKSEVKRSGGEPITIDYSLEKSSGDWKVYDVAIGGVSLVTTYRDSFREEIRSSGIDGLIKLLIEKNQGKK